MTSNSFSKCLFFKLICFLLPFLFVFANIALVKAAEDDRLIEIAQKDKTKPEAEEEEEDDC